MYYLTKQDPNYTIKGSRDPLGLQVIWQIAGRKLIPHLSTVSVNIKDFQILCLASILKEKLSIVNDGDFESFFIRFEQMMAYTRFNLKHNEGFNGVDKVKKIMTSAPLTVRVSNAPVDQLLSNQKAYGIWGKYIRPFSDMKIESDSEFKNILYQKILNDTFMHQVEIVRKKKDGQTTLIETNKLSSWEDLLNKPVYAEKKLFIEKLLIDTCGNELLAFFDENPGWRNLNFYVLMKTLSDSSDNSIFRSIISIIVNTEKVISPLNRIFRYLQTKSFWKQSEIEQDDFIRKWRSKPDVSGFDETLRSLAVLLQLDNYDLVKGLIKRNEEVTGRRDSAAWMQINDIGIDINHFEGAFFDKDYNPHTDNDFNYFLSTYVSLHKQLN